jgi:RNA recognition motif-containing protein
MFDASRVRGDVPQSRGYGFVEFESHAHALACLRELNNNAKYSALSAEGGKLIVEFSVENIQKVLPLLSSSFIPFPLSSVKGIWCGAGEDIGGEEGSLGGPTRCFERVSSDDREVFAE